jgi:hypothetical protein
MLNNATLHPQSLFAGFASSSEQWLFLTGLCNGDAACFLGERWLLKWYLHQLRLIKGPMLQSVPLTWNMSLATFHNLCQRNVKFKVSNSSAAQYLSDHWVAWHAVMASYRCNYHITQNIPFSYNTNHCSQILKREIIIYTFFRFNCNRRVFLASDAALNVKKNESFSLMHNEICRGKILYTRVFGRTQAENHPSKCSHIQRAEFYGCCQTPRGIRTSCLYSNNLRRMGQLKMLDIS